MKRVVIVGGGVTGLTTAVNVLEKAESAGADVEVVVLEAGPAPGGNIRTERAAGYTIENGPNGFLDNAPRTLELVRRIGLEDALLPADETAGKRFIYRGGTLHEVPTGPVGFLRSGLLSLRGRLRVFAEPFARSRPDDIDETIYDFAARRIGPEAASVLIDAMVSGVFAGNVHELSLRSSFPKMAKMEAEHGGLVKAMIARMKERRAAKKEVAARRARGEDVEELTAPGGPAGPGGHLTSFEDGLDTLIRGLVDALPAGTVRTDAPVASVTRGPGRSGPGSPAGPRDPAGTPAGPAEGAVGGPGGPTDRPWRVTLADGDVIGADAVVVTIPSPRAAPLVRELDTELSETVAAIETAGLAVVAMAWDAAAVPDADGFGFLVPRGEGPRILGCLWDSSIFPGRAPDGKVLLRCMIGGAHDPAAVSEPGGVLLRQCRADLEDAMGITAEPELTRVYRWPLGIGQYTVGHRDRMDAIHRRLEAHPGLWVAGSSYYGVAMNACIEKAWDQADEIVAHVRAGAPAAG
ncbi:MAG: protoporphyrinogen oxidase [Longimicrobiales bacterium]|nr:protoporphyrinogen oxidase [Longimicrobiales bacterium]